LARGAGAHQAARDPDAEHCVSCATCHRTAQEQRVHSEWGCARGAPSVGPGGQGGLGLSWAAERAIIFFFTQQTGKKEKEIACRTPSIASIARKARKARSGCTRCSRRCNRTETCTKSAKRSRESSALRWGQSAAQFCATCGTRPRGKSGASRRSYATLPRPRRPPCTQRPRKRARLCAMTCSSTSSRGT
jgi:hypothetical protein